METNAQSAFLHTFGNQNRSEANAVIQTSDGGYAVTGWYDVQGSFTEECYLIKTDEFGDTDESSERTRHRMQLGRPPTRLARVSS